LSALSLAIQAVAQERGATTLSCRAANARRLSAATVLINWANAVHAAPLSLAWKEYALIKTAGAH